MLAAISNTTLEVGKQISEIIFVPCFIAFAVFALIFIVDLIKNWKRVDRHSSDIDRLTEINERLNAKVQKLIKELGNYSKQDKAHKAK